MTGEPIARRSVRLRRRQGSFRNTGPPQHLGHLVRREESGDKLSLMTEPSLTPRLYAYEIPTDPGRALDSLVRPEPIAPGEPLTTGAAPDERHWEVVRVEPTERDGLRASPLSGPPGFPRQDVIWSGRLILRRVG